MTNKETDYDETDYDETDYDDWLERDDEALREMEKQEEFEQTQQYIEYLEKENEKQKKILDVVKKLFKEHLLEAIEYDGGYLIMLYAEAEMPITKEQYDLIKEWLKND